jgi:hypothetical protein
MDSANGGDVASRWSSATLSIIAGASPSGRAAYRLTNSTGQTLGKNIPDTASLLVGWKGRLSALNNDNSGNTALFAIRSDSGSLTHLTFCTLSTGVVRIRRGTATGTILADSAIGIVSVDTWHHFEIRATIADSGGRVEVWVDDVKVIDFTGDTRNGGTKTDIDNTGYGRTLGGNWDLSDISIASETTNYGVTMVAMSLPSGNGNSSGLTGSDANQVDNYLHVDEATPDGNTSYVAGDTEGQKDTYALADLPSGTWDVIAVQTVLNAIKSDAGTRFMRPVLRSGTTDYPGASVAVAESYLSYLEVFTTDPDTAAAWTQSGVNALEVGPEVRDS